MQQQLQFEWYDIERDPSGWDEAVSAMGQNVFHRSAVLATEQWGRAVRRGVVVKRFGARLCVLGGLVTPLAMGGRFHALSFPPCAERAPADLPQRLTEWLLYQGVTDIRIGSFDGGVEAFAATARPSRSNERLEFIYDLTLSEEQRLRAANSNHRRKLRRSESDPMVLRRIDHRQAWTMMRLRATWGKRRGEHLSLKWLWRNYRYYHRLTTHLGQDSSARLYGLFSETSGILSMAYMLERDGASFYMIGASSEEGYKRGASVRLFFELARHYPGAGIRTMNFGGVPVEAREERHEENGVYRFKTGFGIEPTLRRSLTIEV
jgi:hypothetical protein